MRANLNVGINPDGKGDLSPSIHLHSPDIKCDHTIRQRAARDVTHLIWQRIGDRDAISCLRAAVGIDNRIGNQLARRDVRATGSIFARTTKIRLEGNIVSDLIAAHGFSRRRIKVRDVRDRSPRRQALVDLHAKMHRARASSRNIGEIPTNNAGRVHPAIFRIIEGCVIRDRIRNHRVADNGILRIGISERVAQDTSPRHIPTRRDRLAKFDIQRRDIDRCHAQDHPFRIASGHRDRFSAGIIPHKILGVSQASRAGNGSNIRGFPGIGQRHRGIRRRHIGLIGVIRPGRAASRAEDFDQGRSR